MAFPIRNLLSNRNMEMSGAGQERPFRLVAATVSNSAIAVVRGNCSLDGAKRNSGLFRFCQEVVGAYRAVGREWPGGQLLSLLVQRK